MAELTKAEKDKLITDNLKLAGFLAHQYSKSNAIPYNDLYQEGCIGLIKAAQKFDPEKGFKFSTYAVWWVRQAILESITNKSRSVRLPSHIVQVKLKIFKFMTQFAQTEGREPTSMEISNSLNLPVNRIDELLSINICRAEVELSDLQTTEDSLVHDISKEDELAKLLEIVKAELTLKERLVFGLKYGVLKKLFE